MQTTRENNLITNLQLHSKLNSSSKLFTDKNSDTEEQNQEKFLSTLWFLYEIQLVQQNAFEKVKR